MNKLILLALLFFYGPIKAGFDFFTCPDELSSEQLIERGDSSLDMNFRFSNKGNGIELLFYRKNARTHLRLTCYNMIPKELTLNQKNKFVEHKIMLNDQEKRAYIFEYPHIQTTVEQKEYEPSDSSIGKYLINEPRNVNEVNINLMDSETLAEFIQTKKILFYTGAGVSAGVVPIMDQLINSLEISKVKDGLSLNVYIVDIIENSQKYHEAMDHFYNACLNGEPTPCHNALTLLSKKLSCKIITENVDLLHLKTGIHVPIAEAEWLQNEIDIKSLQNLGAVICLGLRSDERGFLGWYKKHNPQGIIIALNLQQPNYLGQEDFFVKCDVQTLLPDLALILNK